MDKVLVINARWVGQLLSLLNIGQNIAFLTTGFNVVELVCGKDNTQTTKEMVPAAEIQCSPGKQQSMSTQHHFD
jgi:hypothetical protein